MIDTTYGDQTEQFHSNLDDLLGICDSIETESSCTDPLLSYLDDTNDLLNISSEPNPKPTSSFSFDLFSKLHKTAVPQASKSAVEKNMPKPSKSDKKASAWFDLFADLDPLANPAAMEQKISSANKNYMDA